MKRAWGLLLAATVLALATLQTARSDFAEDYGYDVATGTAGDDTSHELLINRLDGVEGEEEDDQYWLEMEHFGGFQEDPYSYETYEQNIDEQREADEDVAIRAAEDDEGLDDEATDAHPVHTDAWKPKYQPQATHPLFQWDNCVQDGATVILNGTDSCHLVLMGADQRVPLMEGGVDGEYKLSGCYQGKAQYVRDPETTTSRRILWFNPVYGDWEVTVSESAKLEDASGQAVMYSSFGQLAPLDVLVWHVTNRWTPLPYNAASAAELPEAPTDAPPFTEKFIATTEGITVECAAAGSVLVTGRA